MSLSVPECYCSLAAVCSRTRSAVGPSPSPSPSPNQRRVAQGRRRPRLARRVRLLRRGASRMSREWTLFLTLTQTAAMSTFRLFSRGRGRRDETFVQKST
eukprot:Amastigsp_a508881_19.p3 type:complete len:100 gc:universal Amastigsp_a508881_19:350-51(-)